jgi:DNA (cytosine-5)-methyltransferase 1
MWPATIAVVREVRPRYVFLENVPGLLAGSHGYFGRILGELAESGYDARWCVLGADDVGAPHRRKRLWVVGWDTQSNEDCEIGGIQKGPNTYPIGACGNTTDATDNTRTTGYSDSCGCEGPQERANGRLSVLAPFCGEVANAGQLRCNARGSKQSLQGTRTHGKARGKMVNNWWITEPDVGRVAHGVASRVDRLRAIGNGQVSRVVATAWGMLTS